MTQQALHNEAVLAAAKALHRFWCSDPYCDYSTDEWNKAERMVQATLPLVTEIVAQAIDDWRLQSCYPQRTDEDKTRASSYMRAAELARQLYGTTLRCSCGWRPEAHRCKVSNEAPSKGGRAAALRIHEKHVAEVAL